MECYLIILNPLCRHSAYGLIHVMHADLRVEQLTPVQLLGGVHSHRYVEDWLEHTPFSQGFEAQ